MKKRVSSVVKYADQDVGSAESRDSEISTNSSDDSYNSVSIDQLIRFDASIVWERTATGYRIVDLHNDRTNTALELISSYLSQEEPTSLISSLSTDTVSLKSLRQFLMKIITENNSLCAIREGTGQLAGLAVASNRSKTDKNYPTNDGEYFSLVMSMENSIFDEAKVNNVLENVEKYFKVNALYVESRHRGKGVGTALLRSCVTKTKSLNLSTCVGIFSSDASQRIASRLGFEKLAEILYSTFTSENGKNNPFANAGPENYSLACMALQIIPEIDTSPLPDISLPSTNVSRKSKKK